MIVYIEEGDIFSFSTIKNYAHGCNCAGAMGKGIALAFKEKFPDMYDEYKYTQHKERLNIKQENLKCKWKEIDMAIKGKQ